MKKIKFSSLAMALIMGLSVASTTPSAFANTKTAEKREMKKERREHPRLVKAIRNLRSAIEYLEKAPHDFGGHRANAIAASKTAVAELQKALDYR